MRKIFRLLPENPQLNLIRYQRLSIGFSIVLIIASIAATAMMGLNFGIDFRGGILIEVRQETPVDIAAMRSDLGALDIGEVSLQEFGEPEDVLIRIQLPEGDESAQAAVIQLVQDTLGEGFDYRRVEFVGPTVGAELIESGIQAVVLSLIGIMIYIWFRFEWRFGLCAVVALFHDVIATIGLFAVIQHEFNLATVAALLTIAGYSINDTVVVFDRVRENLRRYKRPPLIEVLNRSVNETLSRTVVTSFTTMLALVALMVFGGPIIRDFCFALAWGIVIGTYSSIFVAVALLLYLRVRGNEPRVEDVAPSFD